MTIIISGLREIAPEYDALICDVWGVLHDGNIANAAACAALKTFKEACGPVVLLTNAPRPVADVEEMFKKFGVPLDCYNTIVTSGVAAREDLEARTKSGRLAMLHLGPDRDRGIFDGLTIETADWNARRSFCAAVYMTTTPNARGLCAASGADEIARPHHDLRNPDWVVQRDGKLIYCAGALAHEYEKIGGEVIYYGKPRTAIYGNVRAALKGAKKPLAIGDGMHTDIKGANAAGFDALFIADGIHGEDVAEMTPQHLGKLFADAGVHARAAMRALVW